MDKMVKKKWITALRSGGFKQTSHGLRRKEHKGYSYCCLGVLCEISGLTRKLPRSESENGNKFYTYTDKDGAEYQTNFRGNSSKTGLPYTFMKRLNINEDEMEKLIGLNDIARLNFDAIADWIEKKL